MAYDLGEFSEGTRFFCGLLADWDSFCIFASLFCKKESVMGT